jgi:hypothetical protein
VPLLEFYDQPGWGRLLAAPDHAAAVHLDRRRLLLAPALSHHRQGPGRRLPLATLHSPLATRQAPAAARRGRSK